MTVSTEINHEEYVGNGVATVFPYRFRIFKASNMAVVKIDPNGVETTLVLNTDFTLSGIGSYTGGNVTLPSPLPTDWGLTLTRQLPTIQETDLRNQGTFFAETHEDALDYLTMLIQQVGSWFNLALRKPTFLSNFYDALNNRISNLADPTREQDAVNNRSMKNYVEIMIAGVVGGFGWFIQSGFGAIYRTFQNKMRDVIHVKDFGAAGDGVTDDTAAFLNALAAFSTRGGTLKVGNNKYLVGNLTIPIGVTISGDNYQPYEVDVGKSYYDCSGQLRCKSGTTITLLRGTGVVNLLIIKDGLPSVITTNAHAAAAIAAFKDKAFTSIDPDVYFENVLVLGFEYAFYSNPTTPNVGRRTFKNFRGDCTNGIYANYGLDVDRLSGCHFWPYLTAHIAEATTPANLQRSGKAYYFGNIADWTEFSNCFSYGYDAHIHIDNGYSVKIRGGGGDACGSVAVLITGASRFVYVEGISTNSFHLGLSVATTGSEPEVRSINNNWAAVEQGIYVTSGTLISTSDHFSQGSVGVSFSDGTVLGILNSPHFSGVTLPWSNTALSAPKVYVNNPSYGATQIWSTSAVREKAVSSSIYDPRAATGGTGAALELGGNNNGGQIGQFRVQPRLTNATVGSTLSDVYFSIFANSAYIDRWVMQGDGTYRPGADGTQAVGSPTFRCGTIYSSSGAINTSDERAKEDIRAIEDNVLDAWSKVEFLSFKYKDSIKDKGVNKSRVHFGVIAQRVKEAFEAEGIDPFEYGVLCYDEWDAVPGFIDEVNGVNQEAISAGNRYGIRYEEALILECALIRRVLNKMKG